MRPRLSQVFRSWLFEVKAARQLTAPWQGAVGGDTHHPGLRLEGLPLKKGSCYQTTAFFMCAGRLGQGGKGVSRSEGTLVLFLDEFFGEVQKRSQPFWPQSLNFSVERWVDWADLTPVKLPVLHSMGSVSVTRRRPTDEVQRG